MLEGLGCIGCREGLKVLSEACCAAKYLALNLSAF